MIGQKNLLEKINKYTLDTFPHSVLFVGERGCGKHTLANYVSENILNIPITDITKSLSYELISDIYRTTTPNIYLINLNEITEKEQNIILKFVEEPLINSFIILICNNKNFVLNTVLNRCVPFEFENYTQTELSNFYEENIDKDIVLKVLRTPGKIKSVNLKNLSEMQDVSNKMLEKLTQATLSNTLTIKNKINFKDEYDKFDLEIFLDMLTYLAYNRFLKEYDINMYKMFETIKNMRKRLSNSRLNKELFIENLLLKLWKGVRNI